MQILHDTKVQKDLLENALAPCQRDTRKRYMYIIIIVHNTQVKLQKKN